MEEQATNALEEIVTTEGQDEGGNTLLAALRTLGAWAVRERQAQLFGNLWQLNPDACPIPPDLAKLNSELGRMDLRQLADPDLLGMTIDELANKLFAGMPMRERAIYCRRVVEGATLEVVGSEIGVTRERVRQLQKRVEGRIDWLLHNDLSRPLWWRATDLRMDLGEAAPLDHGATQRALGRSLRDASPESAFLLRPLILRLAGPYRERDGWLVLEQTAELEFSTVQGMADEFGLVPMADVREWLITRGMRPEFHDLWLKGSGKFRKVEDHLVLWSGNVVDKCVALLALRNEPADVKTLVTLVGEGHNVRGVKNRFFEEERLVRVNRTHWALRKWEMEEYTSITEEIAQRIVEAGGQIEVRSVVSEIVRQFGVNENSVYTFTAAPMFLVEGELIRLRKDDEPVEMFGTLRSCAGAFHSSQHVISLLLSVDANLLRGSGCSLNGPVAAALGVVPGQSRSYLHERGVLNITWPMTSAFGPSLGSSRTLASKAGAAEGERVRLDFDLKQGRVSGERIPQDLNGYRDAKAIRLLTGICADFDNVSVAIANAIDTTTPNVRRVLIERGDAELADLLPDDDVDTPLKSTLDDLARLISRG